MPKGQRKLLDFMSGREVEEAGEIEGGHEGGVEGRGSGPGGLPAYFKSAERATAPRREPKLVSKEDLASFSPEEPEELDRAFVIDVSYDGGRGCARVKLYEPIEQKVYVWYDRTGHKPYCLTDLRPEEVSKLRAVMEHPGFDHLEVVEKYDLLRDRRVKVTKVVAKDPLSIGGRPKGVIRDLLREEAKRILGYEAKVWEAVIKYHECYIYDTALIPGMPYRISGGQLTPAWERPKTISRILDSLEGEPEEFRRKAIEWATLLECEAPNLRRVALDIEVLAEVPTRVPDAREATQPIICVALVGSDGLERVLLLRRPGVEEGAFGLPEHVRVEFYDSEEELLLAVFGALIDYPVVVTFNGDEFDLRYLFHRAERLGFKRQEIPIEPGRDKYSLRYGIHMDLYKFFKITALQVYAFGKKYENASLDEVGEALLGMRKVELAKPLSELTYAELARYCYQDALITLRLTQFDNDLVMKLAVLLSRISKMPIEDATRLSVSRWIRSFMQYELRRMGALIPNPDDILAEKGQTATKAIVKGRYMGAIVVKPKPGIHMDVVVLDFASLYPSAMKVWNLSFETVRCPHEECRDNLVPGLPHWVCKKRKGISSLLIGSLRDLRVHWYKPKSKDKKLPKRVRDWYKVVQLTLKVILNASYGVFGADIFEFYCPPVAESTAAVGRHAITSVIEKCHELGMEVLYGDTDSVFLKKPSEEQIEALIDWADRALKLDLDIDKVYRYVVFSERKKNYLGVLADGTVDVKGLLGKKKHIPKFIKEAFKAVVDELVLVKEPEDLDVAKERIKAILRERYQRLKNRQFEPADLALHVTLGKEPEKYTKTTPQHVKAAKVLELIRPEGKLKAGDIISFVKVVPISVDEVVRRARPSLRPEERKELADDLRAFVKDKYVDVLPIELATREDVDVDKYISLLESTFEQILDALGMSFSEVIGLTRLESFIT